MIKAALTDSITELFESTNPEVRQWIMDVVAMQFYMTGGTDTSFGSSVKATFYDALPLEKLANMETMFNGKNVRFNDYINTEHFEANINSFISQVMMQLSISDDEFVPVVKAYGKEGDFKYLSMTGDGSVAVLRKAGASVAQNREGSRYAKYIKIQQNYTSTPVLYVLGNVVKTTTIRKDKTTGEQRPVTYFNPVYFRVNKLGYSQYSNRSNSIRVDGATVNGEFISMFNTRQHARTNMNKMIPFSATNIAELRSESVPGMKYAASMEFDNMFKKSADMQILNVDELGNVLYDFYDGIFDVNNPQNTTLVVSRLNQFPTDKNMQYIQHAKEVGAKFVQIIRNKDGNIQIIGNVDSLTGEISLLTTNDAEFNEVANIIFEQFPGITAVNGTGENYTTRAESEAEKVMREKKANKKMKNEEC